MSHFLSPMQNEELTTSEQTSNRYTGTPIKEINILAALALFLFSSNALFTFLCACQFVFVV